LNRLHIYWHSLWRKLHKVKLAEQFHITLGDITKIEILWLQPHAQKLRIVHASIRGILVLVWIINTLSCLVLRWCEWIIWLLRNWYPWRN